MAVFLAVHGTGVRLHGFEMWLKTLERRVKSLNPAHQLAFCHWGDGLGANVAGELKSIPTGRQRQRKPKDTEEDRWDLLYRDPLFELKVRAVRGAELRSRSRSLGNNNTASDLVPSERVLTAARVCGLEAVISSSMLTVSKSECFADATFGAKDQKTHFRFEVARSICATAVLQCRDDGVTPSFVSNREPRKCLILEIVEQLGGTEASLGDWIGAPFRTLGRQIQHQLATIASRIGTRWLSRNVDEIYNSHYPKIGDILLYQSNGSLIRSLISNSIKEQEDKVVILAHSLGGVAAFETLVVDALKSGELCSKVLALITMGSQSPFFYETNSLTTLPYEPTLPELSRLPTGFPKWLNFYDSSDFLSFVAEPLFSSRVQDIELESEQPFPLSHSSYWESDPFWEALADVDR